MNIIPKTLTGPIRVQRHEREDGAIDYELWDEGAGTFHQVCSVTEDTSDNAKAEADFIALAMNNAIGALRAIEAQTGSIAVN
jgi:hypothetical protein